jgi:hypothetical protein
MNVLVGVIVYNRTYTINQWLRAWNNADKRGARLIVVHNYDGDAPSELATTNITKHSPDIYYARPNVGQDIGALYDVIHARKYDPWDVLCWFVDDNLPMQQDFLAPFLTPLEKDPRIGLVGNYWVRNGFWPGLCVPDHFRTTAFSIRRKAALQLRFPSPINDKDDCYHFEWAGDAVNMTNQVRRMGYSVVPTCGNFRHAWTDCNNYVWDVESLGPRAKDPRCRKDLWKTFEQQFSNAAMSSTG